MTMRALVGLLVLGLAGATGCGDDDTGGGTDSGTAGGTDGGGEDAGVGTDAGAGTDAGEPGDAGSPGDGGGVDAAAPAGACTSESDIAAQSRMDYGPDMDEDITGVSAACGQECFIGRDRETCLATCFDERMEGGLSMGCIECYVATTTCILDNCFEPCATGLGNECQECACENNCTGAFDECSGIPTSGDLCM